MTKKIFIAVILLLAAVVYYYRYECLFAFQYQRLKGLSCQTTAADFINDSCLNKLWVHRVNSIERYTILKRKFAGSETDIVWDGTTKHFLVYHPPLEDTPVSFDTFLNAVNTAEELLWLDTRETPEGDTAAILQELNRLNTRHRIKMNAIIELYDTAVANYLAEHDYWIALNIHPEWISSYNSSQWQQLKQSMSANISFISQEDIHVPFLKKQFPGKNIITWSLAFNNYINRRHLQQLLTDQQIKVVLVNIKSRYKR